MLSEQEILWHVTVTYMYKETSRKSYDDNILEHVTKYMK